MEGKEAPCRDSVITKPNKVCRLSGILKSSGDQTTAILPLCLPYVCPTTYLLLLASGKDFKNKTKIPFLSIPLFPTPVSLLPHAA